MSLQSNGHKPRISPAYVGIDVMLLAIWYNNTISWANNSYYDQRVLFVNTIILHIKENKQL